MEKDLKIKSIPSLEYQSFLTLVQKKTGQEILNSAKGYESTLRLLIKKEYVTRFFKDMLGLTFEISDQEIYEVMSSQYNYLLIEELLVYSYIRQVIGFDDYNIFSEQEIVGMLKKYGLDLTLTSVIQGKSLFLNRPESATIHLHDVGNENIITIDYYKGSNIRAVWNGTQELVYVSKDLVFIESKKILQQKGFNDLLKYIEKQSPENLTVNVGYVQMSTEYYSQGSIKLSDIRLSKIYTLVQLLRLLVIDSGFMISDWMQREIDD